jgi:hypothetical protein
MVTLPGRDLPVQTGHLQIFSVDAFDEIEQRTLPNVYQAR